MPGPIKFPPSVHPGVNMARQGVTSTEGNSTAGRAEGGEGSKPMSSAQKLQEKPLGRAMQPRKHRTQRALGTGESCTPLGTEPVTAGCTGPGGEVGGLPTQALGTRLF